LLAVTPIFYPDSIGPSFKPAAATRSWQIEHLDINDPSEIDLSDLAPTPGEQIRVSPENGIQVIRFHVWQDLTACPGEGSAPLYTTLTFEMTSEWYLNLNTSCGTIRMEGVQSEALVQAKLVLNRAHHGLGLIQPGSRQLQFVMSPTPMHMRLDANEIVRGIARVRFGDRQVVAKLPETKVIFTR